MGKLGRFACIFTPMAMTIASLVCLVIVGLGGTNKNSDSLNGLYFFRANTSDINVKPSDINLPSNPLTDAILNETTDVAKKAIGIKDFYHVALWNYCDGDFTKNKSGGWNDHVTFCSPRKSEFWFDPVEVWNLNQTLADHVFSKELKDGLDAYKTASKWMYIAYIVAVISTAVEIVIGISALFSRLGSLATTIVSTVSSVFVVGFALTATILYSTLAGAFNSALKKYNVHGSLGHDIYVWTWLAVLFSFGAGFFWLISSCCCSGRSDRIKGYEDGGRRGAKPVPYVYERMPSPMPAQPANFHQGVGYQQHGTPLGNMQRGTAYEPYRHESA